MKAMILAAGRGSRLRPLTDVTPKPLLQAGEHRLIEHLIYKLVAAGITEIVINHAHLGAQFPATLGDGSRYGAAIQYSAEIDGGLETAGGIINALPLLGDTPFLIVNGDVWTDYPFASLPMLANNMLAHLVLVDNPPQHPDGDFSLSDNIVDDAGSPRFTYSGMGIYHPDFFAGYDVQRLALRPLLAAAMSQQRVTGESYHGEWSDIGTVERLESLRQQLKK